MSIIQSFDSLSEEIISPAVTAPAVEGFPETVITAFTEEFPDLLLRSYKTEKISEMMGGRSIPIYSFLYGGKKLGFYHTLLGGSASAALLEEVIAKGAKKILFFGSCGSLDKSITAGHLIVPTAAYRDEGTSYHYAPAGDYIEVATAQKLAEVFDTIGAPYIKTKTWTTDGFYRETKNNVIARKNEGCSVVEMECASVMSVGQYRKVGVYEFLYAADCLDETGWDIRILSGNPDNLSERILKTALETAIRL